MIIFTSLFTSNIFAFYLSNYSSFIGSILLFYFIIINKKKSRMDEKQTFNMIAMIVLFIMGALFIGQGVYFINQKKLENLPARMYGIGVGSIIVGVAAFGFGGMYAFFLN